MGYTKIVFCQLWAPKDRERPLPNTHPPPFSQFFILIPLPILTLIYRFCDTFIFHEFFIFLSLSLSVDLTIDFYCEILMQEHFGLLSPIVFPAAWKIQLFD